MDLILQLLQTYFQIIRTFSNILCTDSSEAPCEGIENLPMLFGDHANVDI